MKISFIIVEYFSIDDINECVASISERISLDYEILISSNSLYSKEKQYILLKEYPLCKWIFNSKNGGFAYAMNCGLKNANGDVLVIMNPDVRINSSLELMIDYLCTNNIGIIAPKIINRTGICQDSYRNFITPLNFITRNLKRILRFNSCDILKQITSPLTVDWVIGAFMMMTKEIYKEINGFDENYFLYCEDMDICRRVSENGYDVVYFPDAEVVYEGTRSARKSSKYAFIFMRSLIHYWKKNI
jgi:GT2 family glycosyltransferase